MKNLFAPHPTQWEMISLRPEGQHYLLEQAVLPFNGKILEISPWQIQSQLQPELLPSALAADRVIFTSPIAVEMASLQSLLKYKHSSQYWLAVGEGTRQSLIKKGICHVIAPSRMDSEGLLSLSELNNIENLMVGLITAPDGRSLLQSTLIERGATVIRANVYRRVIIPVSISAINHLKEISSPFFLALSSEHALRDVLQQLSPELVSLLQKSWVIAASQRLLEYAKNQGFKMVYLAKGPQPMQIAECAADIWRLYLNSK